MPIREDHPEVIRLVEGLKGTVQMRMCLAIRMGYGCTVPWVRHQDGLLTAIAGPDGLALWTPVDTRGEDFQTGRRLHGQRGRDGPVRPYMVPVARTTSAPDRRALLDRRHGLVVGGLVGALHRPRRVPARGAPLAHHLEGAHVPADRRHRRGRDHLAARDPRRSAELGLPLLLAPRRHA